MRILTILDSAYDKSWHGGMQTVAQETARRLVERGHEVTFIARQHDAQAPLRESRDGVQVTRYRRGFGPVATIDGARRLARELWSERPFDIVHTHFAYSALGPSMALPRSVPHLRTFHGAWDQEAEAGWGGPERAVVKNLKRGFRRWVETRDVQHSDAVVTLSEHSRRYVLERFGNDPASVHAVAGGVDFGRFKPVSDKRALREELRLEPDGRLVLFVGRLVQPKGPFALLEAIGELFRRDSTARLVIAGDGPEGNEVRQAAQTLGIGDKVHFPGYVRDRLPDYYMAADLLVLPSFIPETFGLVTAEALACGLPAIGTPLGATVEILGGIEPRLLMRETGVSAIAAGLNDFFYSDWARELTPERVSAYARQRFSWDHHAAQVEAICLGLVAPANG